MLHLRSRPIPPIILGLLAAVLASTGAAATAAADAPAQQAKPPAPLPSPVTTVVEPEVIEVTAREQKIVPIQTEGEPVEANGQVSTLRDAPNPESTEGGRRVSILKRPEGALLNLG